MPRIDPDRRAPGGNGATRIQENNRRVIIEAALEVFSAHGFRGSTIDQIADLAGMSKPNLLYYFPRKKDIYAQVLEHTVAEWLHPFTEIDPEGDPVEELSRYIRRKLEMSAQNPEASKLFANEILHGAPVIGDFLRTSLRQLVDEKAAVISRWVSSGRLAPVDPYHLVFLIWATTQHYADFDVQIEAVLGSRARSEKFRNEAATAILDIVLGGIRPRT